MNELSSRTRKKIEELSSRNQLRSLRTSNAALVDFTSNDYLGLAKSEKLHALIQATVSSRGLKANGATGSRLLAGNTPYVEEVERKLATLFCSEATLIFNSGYVANLSVLSALPQKGDTIFYDELSHASIKDGIRMSLANRFSFRHNDLDDLRNKLSRMSEGLAFIVVESVYSMDGDACPLGDLVTLAKEKGAVIIVDEAHSTGIYGKNGNGLTNALNLEKEIDIKIFTFGKAMGIHGACVACSDVIKQYIINFSRPFIYTTALPPHSVAAVDCAFEYLKDNISLQAKLYDKIALFKKHYHHETYSVSPIQPILIPGNDRVKAVASKLVEDGFDVRPILSPTVKAGSERLRVCLHTFNNDDEVIALAQAFNKVYIHNPM